MKNHQICDEARDDSHGSHQSTLPRERPQWQDALTVRKVPADSVPFGESISRNGRTVFAAYDGERLVAVGATTEEARRKYRDAYYAEGAKRAAKKRAEGDGQKS